MSYYTLVTKEYDGKWSIQFGDYDKHCVECERTEYIHNSTLRYKRSDLKIIETKSARQSEINKAVDELNKTL